jgi:hypothetical protein
MPGSPATTKTSPLSKAANDALTGVVKDYTGLYNSGSGFKAPNFNAVAGFNPMQNRAMSGIMGYAGKGNPLAGQSQSAISSILNGDIASKYGDLFDNASNAAFEGATNTQAGHLTDDINRQYGGLGRTGSVANAGDIASQVGDFREKAMSDNWAQNIANQRGILGDSVNSQLSAVQAAPGAWSQGLLPYAAMSQVGDQRQAQSQKMLDQKLSNFNINQQAPWNRLNAYATGLGGPASQLGTQSSTTAATNPLGGLLGGLLTGGQIGSMIPGIGAGAGAGIGGGLGLLSNMFSF